MMITTIYCVIFFYITNRVFKRTKNICIFNYISNIIIICLTLLNKPENQLIPLLFTDYHTSDFLSLVTNKYLIKFILYKYKLSSINCQRSQDPHFEVVIAYLRETSQQRFCIAPQGH